MLTTLNEYEGHPRSTRGRNIEKMANRKLYHSALLGKVSTRNIAKLHTSPFRNWEYRQKIIKKKY